MGFPFFHLLEEGYPVFVQLDENGVTDFGWQGSVGFMRLYQMKHFHIVEIDSLEDEGLAHQVIGGIVEILGGKGGLIDLFKPRITSINDRIEGSSFSVQQ